LTTPPRALDAVQAAGAITRKFEPRRLAFTWRARSLAVALRCDQVLAAAERHLLERHARVEHEGDGRALRFGSDSRARRSWLGATRGGRLEVRESDGAIDVTVHAVVARTLLICAVPALLLGTFVAWPLGLPFALVGAANLWSVDVGARRLILIAAALQR
jgi:hypothetical protein